MDGYSPLNKHNLQLSFQPIKVSTAALRDILLVQKILAFTRKPSEGVITLLVVLLIQILLHEQSLLCEAI